MSGSEKAHTQVSVADLFRAQTKKKEQLVVANAAARRANDPQAAQEDDAAAALKSRLVEARKGKAHLYPSLAESLASVELPTKTHLILPVTAEQQQQRPTQIPLLSRKFVRTAVSSETSVLTKRKEREPSSNEQTPEISFDNRSKTTISELPPETETTTTLQPYKIIQPASGGLGSTSSRLLPQRAQQTTVVAPDVKAMKKHNRKAGGQPAGPSVWFYACYENSATLGKVLGTFADFAENFTLIFTDAGLRVALDDDGHLLHLRLDVPKASFVCYENLCDSAISFVIAGKKIKRFSKLCAANNTLTFCRNQNGDKGAPLELMLCPLDGSFESGAVTRASFKPSDEQKPQLMPVAYHQFQIVMPSSLYETKIRGLVNEASDICFELSATTLKLSSIDADLGGDLYYGIPVKSTLEEAMQNNCCYVERVLGADPAVQVNSMPPVRFLAAYLESVTRFSGAGVNKVTLRMGLRDNPREPGTKEDSLLYVSYVYAEGTPAAFTLKTWLTPQIELD